MEESILGQFVLQKKSLIKMLNNIKVIGFDLDNTLYSSTPEIHEKIRGKIYENLSLEFNIPNNTAKELFEKFYSKHLSGTEAVKSIEKILKHSINEKDIIQESVEQADFLDLIKKDLKLRDMLIRLKSKRDIDLITGSHYPLVIRKLDRIGIQDIFRYVFTSENGEKRFGDTYQKWITLNQFPPSKLLYVGDNPKQDIDVPKSLGIQTCIIGNYDNADFEINDILGLEDLILK